MSPSKLVPEFVPGSQIVFGEKGYAYVRSGTEIFHMQGVSETLLRPFLSAVDGERNLHLICEMLPFNLSPAQAEVLCRKLEGTLIRFRKTKTKQQEEVPPYRKQISILGEGRLAELIAQALAPRTQLLVRRVSFDHAFKDQEVEKTDLFLLAPERIDLGQLLRFQEQIKSRPSLYILPEHDHILLGPLHQPGKTACLRCTWRVVHGLIDQTIPPTLEKIRFPDLQVPPEDEVAFRENLNREINRWIDSFLQANPEAAVTPFQEMRKLHIRGGQQAQKTLIPRLRDCPCSANDLHSQKPELKTELRTAGIPLRPLSMSQSGFSSVSQMELPLRKIGIVGGGSAGYLTALGLKQAFPEIEIDVLESSGIPTIGVGEATTTFLVHFLHQVLKVDVAEFYKEVKPTWKLGVNFQWGAQEGYAFNYPFSRGELGAAKWLENDMGTASLSAALMKSKLAPLFKQENGSYIAGLGHLRYAYHLDNQRFVTYLRALAQRSGIRRIDTLIQEVVTDEAKQRVSKLCTDDGREFAYDLYIDCTGFRSMLMGQALKSPFHDYRKSLYTDRAIIAKRPHTGPLTPYTLSQTMDHGWCWHVPTQEEQHLGYVFASDYCSEEQARQEMREKFQVEPSEKAIRFRSGRHAHFWKGNVVCVGNAHAFVEPLESTGIHMIVQSVLSLVKYLPGAYNNSGMIDLVNRKINGHWDYLKWFLALHYRFNNRLNTPFWKACRRDTDISGLADIVEIYQESGPLSELEAPSKALLLDRIQDPTFGLRGIDQILMGLQVPHGGEPNWNARQRLLWQEKRQSILKLTDHALQHDQALQIVTDHPELISFPPDNSNL